VKTRLSGPSLPAPLPSEKRSPLASWRSRSAVGQGTLNGSGRVEQLSDTELVRIALGEHAETMIPVSPPLTALG
jgi:hypothetical protein